MSDTLPTQEQMASHPRAAELKIALAQIEKSATTIKEVLGLAGLALIEQDLLYVFYGPFPVVAYQVFRDKASSPSAAGNVAHAPTDDAMDEDSILVKRLQTPQQPRTTAPNPETPIRQTSQSAHSTPASYQFQSSPMDHL